MPSRHHLEEQMRSIGIADADLRESYYTARGPGGQNVNKVASAVRLRHVPTGISVIAQDSRSQAANRRLARLRLLAALEKERRLQRAAERGALEKRRRRSSPRPAKLKEAILRTKRKRSELKRQRGVVQE